MKQQTELPILGSAALLQDTEENYLFQVRTDDAPIAPGALACFGGASEQDDADTRETIARELHEELELVIDKTNPEFLGYIENVPREGMATAMYKISGIEYADLVLHEGKRIERVSDLSELRYFERAPFLDALLTELQTTDEPKEEQTQERKPFKFK